MTYPQQPYGQVGGPQRPYYPGPAPAPGPGGWQPPQSPGSWQPPPAARPPRLSFGDFIKRLVGLGHTVISPRERLTLEATGVREERLQHMLVWRRSVLIMILPVSVLAFLLALLGAILVTGEGGAGFTELGLFTLIWIPVITLAALPIGAVIAIVRWTELRWSMQVLFWSWLIATVVPLCTAIFPLAWVVDIQGLVASEGLEADAAAVEGVEIYAGFIFAVTFAVILLPIIIGLAGGVLRGARRTKSLFPATILPGWFVIMVAPLYTIVMLTIFAVISPVLSNGQLTTGVLLLAIAPLVYIIYRKRYTTPMTRAEAPPILAKISMISLVISLAGAVLIASYILTGSVFGRNIMGTPSQDSDGTAWFSYVDTINVGLNLFVRFHLTAVVMCFLFASIAHREWRTTSTMSEEVKREREAEMQSLRRFDDPTTTDMYSAPQGSHQPVPPQPAQPVWQPSAAPTPGWQPPLQPPQSQEPR